MTESMVRTEAAPAILEPSAPVPRSGPRRPRRAPARTALNLLAVAFGLIWLFPVYWMVNTAFLTSSQITSRTPTWFPWAGTGDHFARVLGDDKFWSALRMSTTLALIVVAGALIFGVVAAFALSRFRFRGRNSFIVAVLIIQMIPAEALFISQYRMLDGWGLLNSVIGLSVLYL
ncbi:MAG: carbohydrate ABC transporter permease, partial [Burkholderiaceae bacterium]|nr:carbohydrate ABC transporter permease [Microbacteriaceae bacterium]